MGHLHVDDVAVSQVDFSRTAGTLKHHDIESLGKPLKGLLCRSPILPTHETKILRTQGSGHLASDNKLRRRIGFGLDQDWIEVGSRRQTAGGSLDRLRPANFFAVRRDEGIVGHVLSFEGRDAQTPAEKRPAQGRREDGLSDMRGGSLNHDRSRRHIPISPRPSRRFPVPTEIPVPLVSWPPIEPRQRAHRSGDSQI